jgi:Fe-S cluster assembly iron-binding protein IscA
MEKGLATVLKVTESAVEQFKGILSQANKEEVHIRIFVSGMG